MLFLSLFTCLLLAPDEAPSSPAAKLRRQARTASGFAALAADAELVLEGAGTLHAEKAAFRYRYSRRGAFQRRIDGPLSCEAVFDGTTLWRQDLKAGPYIEEWLGREHELLRAWVHSGYWTLKAAPLEVTASNNPHSLSLRLARGEVSARLELDPDTHLPKTLWLPDGVRDLRVNYADYREVDGVCLAGRVEAQLALGRSAAWELRNARTRAPAEPFPVPSPADDFFIDPEADPRVEVRLSSSKHPYVRAQVNGEDVGFFLFDTGAGFSGISRRVAERLALPRLGETAMTGFGGDVTPARFRRADRLQLGPLEIEDLVMVESEVGQRAADSLGEPVAGVLGWDVLVRCVVELDMRGGEMLLFDPLDRGDDGRPWLPLKLHFQVPYVAARFGAGHQGYFMVDTGAAGLPVYFFAAPTRRLGLLDAAPTGTGERRTGAGGDFYTTVAPLDFFELAGDPWIDSPTVFGVGDDGEDDLYSVGLVGGGLLRLYRLTFDYSRRRLALEER